MGRPGAGTPLFPYPLCFTLPGLPDPFFSVLSSHPHCSVIDGDTLSTAVVTTHTHTQKQTHTVSGELVKLPCAHLPSSALKHNMCESVTTLKLAAAGFSGVSSEV